MVSSLRHSVILFGALLICTALTTDSIAQKRAMTFEDVMKFRNLTGPTVSDNGRWVAYESAPDRGDGHAEVRSTDGRTTYTVERGASAQLSPDGTWAAFVVKPPAPDMEDPAKKDDRPRSGMALVDTRSGNITSFEEVTRFSITDDGNWIIRLHHEPKTKKRWEGGTELVLRKLSDGTEKSIPFVRSFQVDSTSSWLVYTYADSLKLNGLYAINLKSADLATVMLDTLTEGHFSMPAWHQKTGRAAWMAAANGIDKKAGPAALKLWQSGTTTISTLASGQAAQGWMMPNDASPRWTTDGNRIFLGLRPWKEAVAPDTSKKPFKLFDLDALLDTRELDVWHWNDPTISTQQKAQHRMEQSRTWMAVFHVAERRMVPLADETMRTVQFSDNANYAIGLDNRAYAQMTTWDGSYNDIYRVNLRDGSRLRLLEKNRGGGVNMSPEGKWAVFFNDGNWHLIEMSTGEITEVTSRARSVFYDEDTDTPGPPGSYGFGGWVSGDAAFRVYDRFDIWEFDTANPARFRNLTQNSGRSQNITYRIINVDGTSRESVGRNDELHLSGYDNNRKSNGYYRLRPESGGIIHLITEDKRITFVTKVKGTGQMVYTRQTTNEYPDLWLADKDFKGGRKITDFGKQLDQFLIGTSELVKWSDLNGNPLEGVLIKPGNYEPGKRYPVIVYFYELFNQRLHEFNQTIVNHRPSFNFYTSNGYAIFLPDVRYDIGLPGYSATRSLVPGVQKIIDMGIADPKAIGLHGHSWSGYQALHVITQTHIFACAVAGAPVSNMTSAYSGIRWGAGVARQFQYEQGQSRIGGSLWEYPERYIENSPVFFADRIKTPTLIQHGDADEAVPWYQSIEMYLAMRRLGKDAVFLQYRGEPHHLQKYANKLDYSIKMKEYFDHYLKGMPAASWISEGEPYRGK
jgi:dipeptidyl aminopeptidase/acylaminoacyl peptidase